MVQVPLPQQECQRFIYGTQQVAQNQFVLVGGSNEVYEGVDAVFVEDYL